MIEEMGESVFNIQIPLELVYVLLSVCTCVRLVYVRLFVCPVYTILCFDSLGA